MSLFTPGPPVLAGVDEVLRVLTTEALKGLATPVGVTVGPVDRPSAGPRLNWFLYRLEPAAAYVNMEAQPHGWRTRRGSPPLALTLHYLLTADPGELSETGSEDDVTHAALSALMSALHERGIFGTDTPIATGPSRTVVQAAPSLDGLIEPLRITIEPVPFDSVTALWNSGTRPLRLSVPYAISLITVPSQVPFAAGPPVQTRRIGVAPSPAPVLVSVAPATLAFDQLLTVHARGLTDAHRFTLERGRGDPDDPTDGRPDPAHTHSTGPWVLAASSTPDGFTMHLPNAELAAGPRALGVTNQVEGLSAGTGEAMVTIVPAVVSAPGLLHPGTSTTFAVAHVTADGSMFFGGVAVPFVRHTATSIEAVVPPLAAGSSVDVSVRSGTCSGPATRLGVAP